MASDTATKKKAKGGGPFKGKDRWFRLAPVRPDLPDLPEFDRLLDLYWGGPERRITGITLRIIAVNALALLILMFGILYLGQYQNSLINARLETFESELELVSAALSEGTLRPDSASAKLMIDRPDAEKMVQRLSLTMRHRIQLFDENGALIIDSQALPGGDAQQAQNHNGKRQLQSIETLKNMAQFILGFLPDNRVLPPYPQTQPMDVQSYPDVPNALEGQVSVSVWQNAEAHIFLSAAAPIFTKNEIAGAVLLTRVGADIEDDIGGVWLDVLKIFAGTLVLTILLSIYLSGTIARPLKKLARVTEKVRTGQARADDIPDFSHRHDEIGELSVALRQMTGALWDRMDSIERFAADVSHELKNPLTSLRSAVETAAIVKKAGDRKKLMDIIQHDVVRLDRLITDIAQASRVDSEMSREAFEKIDLRKLLGHVVEARAADPLKRAEDQAGFGVRDIQTEGAVIRLDVPDEDGVEVWGLEGRLAQVFQNVLSNALSFTPQGGTIGVSMRARRQKITVSVEDEGPGIPPGKLESIFERFYSERPDDEEYGQHSGLGLSICRQIIEAHGGRIFAENIRGDDGGITGTRLSVVLNKA